MQRKHKGSASHSLKRSQGMPPLVDPPFSQDIVLWICTPHQRQTLIYAWRSPHFPPVYHVILLDQRHLLATCLTLCKECVPPGHSRQDYLGYLTQRPLRKEDRTRILMKREANKKRRK